MLPVNVATCTVTGTFVYADGTIPAGTVEFTPTPSRLADITATPPSLILAAPVTATLDTGGAINATVPATDDADLNPVNWTYLVRVRLNGSVGVAYSFYMAAPAGETIDLATVTPVAQAEGVTRQLIEDPPGSGLYTYTGA